jgi:hypothetical protein
LAWRAFLLGEGYPDQGLYDEEECVELVDSSFVYKGLVYAVRWLEGEARRSVIDEYFSE